jgi:hypothetical protein
MAAIKNDGLSPYRPGNLVRRNKVVTTAWPSDLCIPQNLAQVTPLDIDELVLKHLGFAVTESPALSSLTYKRKVNWQQDIEGDKRELEFFVLFKDASIFMGLINPLDYGEPPEMIEVQFAHDLQNHYAVVTGVDELNVLLVNRK